MSQMWDTDRHASARTCVHDVKRHAYLPSTLLACRGYSCSWWSGSLPMPAKPSPAFSAIRSSVFSGGTENGWKKEERNSC